MHSSNYYDDIDMALLTYLFIENIVSFRIIHQNVKNRGARVNNECNKIIDNINYK